jgi:hypothetical protein
VHSEFDQIGNAWDGAVENANAAPRRVHKQFVLALAGASFIGGDADVAAGPLLRISSRRLIIQRAYEHLAGGRCDEAKKTLGIFIESLFNLVGNSDSFRQTKAVIDMAQRTIGSKAPDQALPMVLAILAQWRRAEGEMTD